MSKHIMEQRDRFNQRLTLHLEMDNGEAMNPQAYLKTLLKTQSLEGWNGRGDEFRDWIAAAMADYWKRCNVRIWGHGI